MKTFLPPDVINHWPEVFSNIEIRAIPILYLESIAVKSKNGLIWKEGIADKSLFELDHIEHEFINFIQTNDIEKIDYKIDAARIKREVTRQTKRMLKRML